MILKPQDLVVALKLVALGDAPWTYLLLASELSMSASEANAGIRRAIQAHLLSPAANRSDKPQTASEVRKWAEEQAEEGGGPGPERGATTSRTAMQKKFPVLRDLCA